MIMWLSKCLLTHALFMDNMGIVKSCSKRAQQDAIKIYKVVDFCRRKKRSLNALVSEAIPLR